MTTFLPTWLGAPHASRARTCCGASSLDAAPAQAVKVRPNREPRGGDISS